VAVEFDPGLIRELRRASGLSIREVADLAGCQRNMLLKVEVGSRRPSVALLVGIANALRVPLDALCRGRPDGPVVGSGARGGRPVGARGARVPPAAVQFTGGEV
jgi:transcriptional regulator with XRE-family HTH domain